MALVAVIACTSCEKIGVVLTGDISTSFPSPAQLAVGQVFSGTIYRATAPISKDENGAYVDLPSVGELASVAIVENGVQKEIIAVISAINPSSIFESKDGSAGYWDFAKYDSYDGHVIRYGVYHYARNSATGKYPGFTLTLGWESRASGQALVPVYRLYIR